MSGEHSRWTPETVTVAQIARMIDHSMLHPTFVPDQIRKGCETAARYQVASVCVRPCDVALASRLLAGTEVLTCTVISFPNGYATISAKAAETRIAVDDGASEIDMVLNIGQLLDGDLGYVEADIHAVVEAAGTAGVKVILENAYLNNAQKTAACQISERAGAAFVKTSTGFAPTGATPADVALMRSAVSPHIGVKAAGGIKNLDALLELGASGANRFGASATAEILQDLASRIANR
jgi:deoxyribose-phosphate aldolase